MKYFDDISHDSTRIGLAYGPVALDTFQANEGLVDYIEVPFEQLRHNPGAGDFQESVPAVLHCASMSAAGFVPPLESTLAAINQEAIRTRTPWIGEHLAYIMADGLDTVPRCDDLPTTLSYTVCPQLSDETIQRTIENLQTLSTYFATPLIVENSPQYFHIPGSQLSMVEFIREIAAGCEVGLLLDLSHFLISAINMDFDPVTELRRLPLERVVEVHLSGYSVQAGRAWDDHSNPAPDLEFQLFHEVLSHVRPRAVTFEYNWGVDFPSELVVNHLTRARRMLSS